MSESVEQTIDCDFVAWMWADQVKINRVLGVGEDHPVGPDLLLDRLRYYDPDGIPQITRAEERGHVTVDRSRMAFILTPQGLRMIESCVFTHNHPHS